MSRILDSLATNCTVRAQELTTLISSTQILLEDNKINEAVGLFERAIQSRIAEIGKNHIHTLELMSAFALFLSKRKKKKLQLRAKHLYVEVLSGFEKELSWTSLETLRVAHDNARLLLKLEMFSKSKRLFHKILGTFEEMYSSTPNHAHILNTVNQIGSILKKEGNLRAAKLMYERSWSGAEESPTLGPTHPTTRMYKNNLIKINACIEAQEELAKIAHEKKMARRQQEEVERQARMEAMNESRK